MSVDIANLTLCHNIAWRFLPSLFRHSSITQLPGFTSIKLAEENWNRLLYDTRIQFLVQLQLAPAACEGAHTPTIHHNMCPGARLHTIRTPPTYHTIRYPTELLTDWAQPPIGLSSSIKDYVGVCLSVQINFVAAPNRRCRIAPHLFWREGIHLPTTSYDLRQPTIRRLAKGRHSRLDPEPGADGATHPHYHTNSGTRLGAAPDRLV